MNGNLALSRAIGDFEFKKSAELPPESQIVTAYPDVTEHDISDDDEFLVVACDGKFPFKSPVSAPDIAKKVFGIVNLLKRLLSSSGVALLPSRTSRLSVKT